MDVVIDESSNIEETVRKTKKNLYDIAFLDIDLKEENNGIELSDMLSEINPKIIKVFFTAHADYTKDALERLVQYYIHKPVDYNFFYRIMEKIYAQIRARRFFLENTSVVEIKIGSEKKKIKGNRIIFFEKSDRKIKIHTVGGEIFEPRGTLHKMEEMIDREMFIRCHKGFIVNKHMVNSYEKSALKMTGTGETIPVGRKYRENVQKFIFCKI